MLSAGAGIVESVGEGVTHLAVGDKVLPCFMPQCRSDCKQCRSKKSNVCVKITATQRSGLMPNDTSRFTCRGQKMHHFMGCSTFSEYTVCAAISCTKIADNAPLETACLIGCGFTTGYGAAMKTAVVEKGSRCAIWGIGGVGMAVLVGCKMAGASDIVAIDICPSKFDLAKQLGATECINPRDIPADKPFQQYLIDKYDGGFDFTFECAGSVDAMKEALESSHSGWGVSVIVGMPSKGQTITVNPISLIAGRKWMASTLGGYRCQDDFPRLVEDALANKFPLDKFVTHRVSLKDINKAFEMLQSGECLRTVISLGPSQEL
jgi:S-(hydroxymethyl)glutathione dehydrogenase/alcohol dehydrogenase